MRLYNKRISSLIFGIAIFAFLFRCFDMRLVALIVPCIAIYVILEISKTYLEIVKGWEVLYIVYVFFLGINLLLSLTIGNGTVGAALRFMLILAIIPIAGVIREPDFEIEWKIFKILSTLRTVICIVLWVLLFIQQDFSCWRKWAIENGVGDIYILNDGIPRIQLAGSSLFVLGAMLDFYNNRKATVYSILMCLGAIVSGNSAYILGIVLYLLFYYINKLFVWMIEGNWRIILFLVIFVMALIFFSAYAVYTLKLKADYSNAVRFEQAHILLKTNYLWGSGLGHTVVAHTAFRNYTGEIYFELQTLYIFNQTGIIGLGLFYLLTIVPLIEKHKTKLVAYFVYLTYTFWNPYCFDSTHIIAILMIANVLNNKCATRRRCEKNRLVHGLCKVYF